MSFWINSGKNTKTLDSFGLATGNTAGGSSMAEFHELELGVVLDIVLDENHPIFKTAEKNHSQIDIPRWPADLEGKVPLPTDLDLSWIGRALVRPLVSGKTIEKDQLSWAYPLENNISEYPLINETVVLVSYGGQIYYTRKVNYHNWANNNLDFSANVSAFGSRNTELFTDTRYSGRIRSVTSNRSSPKDSDDFAGFAGKYFSANNKIRTIKRWEGDLVIESRHGQSIHMTAYDKNRVNDVGDNKYPDYKDGGNPMILIRNRQRQLVKEGQTLKLAHSPNPATVLGTKQEKNVGGYLEENINHDGSSIQMTCGQTISEWVTTCYKQMFTGTLPVLNGDQIVIQSDRLVLSSRFGETFHYAKKHYRVVTDNEYTVDAHGQVVITTDTKMVINSPSIYLGEYDQTGEPAVLGQTAINWLYNFCNAFIAHNHWYHHSHTNAGKESPSQTQMPVEAQPFIALRDSLTTLLSKRVFITGGGFAPGQNGATIPEGTAPGNINVGNGGGVPGGWKGANYRSS